MAKACQKSKIKTEKRGVGTVIPTPLLFILYYLMYARKEVHLRFPLLDVERSDCAIVMLLHLL